MTRRIDLHAHTTHSDGSLSPTALVERAHALGLVALAVTDHDTTSALAEARATAAPLGLEILAGCEITVSMPSGIAHVLAYAFDEDDADFNALLTEVRDGRDERNRKMFEKLEALHVPLDEDDVRKHAVGAIVARPHFAQAMVDRGHVDNIRQAFDHYLRDRGPAYVRARVPKAEDAIRRVKAAGGVTTLAHPRSLKLSNRGAYKEAFQSLKEAGLTGIEVDHPSADESRRRTYGSIADELDLVRTGGSDFHGSTKPHLELGVGDGSVHVTYETWERLLERADRS